MQPLDPTGMAILIVEGEFAGEEGICLGRSLNGSGLWAVTPNSSDRVVDLRFDEQFGVLIDSRQTPGMTGLKFSSHPWS